MEKKQYIYPKIRIETFGTELMYITTIASAPPDNFQGAPRHRTEVF